MKKKRSTYNILKKTAAVFLTAMLIWLTISTPFIITAQENTTDDVTVTWPYGDGDEEGSKEDTSNNSTEEKAPSGANFSEEFLHNDLHANNCYLIAPRKRNFDKTDVYIAFHGELHAPPPNIAI